MKTYVFIIRRICNITGAEQYVRNKLRYLESHGWRVLIFSSIHGPILIEDFKKFEMLIVPALYFCPAYYRKSDVESITNQILNEIGDIHGEDCFIESDSAPRAIWGELIASRIGCRHIFISIQERHGYNEEMIKFLRFKYNRHELAGISKNSINQIFNDDSIEKRDDARISAFCNNVIEDCPDSFSSYLSQRADYILGSFGRVDKPCVPTIVEGLYNFACQHHDKQIDIIMIGGSEKKRIEETIRKTFSKCMNVNLIMTGDLYPVPWSLIKKVNVFVSTAGAANATYFAGIPTIKVIPTTGQPIGIIGLDFDYDSPTKSLYKSFVNSNIDECIERAIADSDKIEFKRELGEDYNKRMNDEFERQLSFFKHSENKEYYNKKLLLKIRKESRHGEFLKFLFFHLFGHNGMNMIRNVKKK